MQQQAPHSHRTPLSHVGRRASVKLALLMCVMQAVAPSAALAAKQYEYYDDAANVLPMGESSSPTEQEIVSDALSMPAVQRAMQDFQTLGYVRAASNDRGASADGHTRAALAYTIPGRPEAAAMIIADTYVSGGALQTLVRGGSFVLDQNGDISPDPSPDMADLTVTISDMSSTEPGNYTSSGPRDAVRKFRDWAMCTVTLCYPIVSGCRVLFMPQAVGTCSAIGCTGAGLLCAV